MEIVAVLLIVLGFVLGRKSAQREAEIVTDTVVMTQDNAMTEEEIGIIFRLHELLDTLSPDIAVAVIGYEIQIERGSLLDEYLSKVAHAIKGLPITVHPYLPGYILVGDGRSIITNNAVESCTVRSRKGKSGNKEKQQNNQNGQGKCPEKKGEFTPPKGYHWDDKEKLFVPNK